MCTEMDVSKQSNLKAEYTETLQTLRFYGNLRFAVLTVFSGLTGGLFTIFYRQGPTTPFNVALAFGGVLVALTFWTAELSAAYVARHFMKRAAEIEHQIGFKGWSTLPGAPAFRALPTTVVLALFYISVLLFWLSRLYVNRFVISNYLN
jgi:hypothetical protein